MAILATIAAYLDEFVFRHSRRGIPQEAFPEAARARDGHGPKPLGIVRGATDLPQFPVRS